MKAVAAPAPEDDNDKFSNIMYSVSKLTAEERIKVVSGLIDMQFSEKALKQMAEMSVGKPLVNRLGSPKGEVATWPPTEHDHTLQKPSLILRLAAKLRHERLAVNIVLDEFGMNGYLESCILNVLTTQRHDEWEDAHFSIHEYDPELIVEALQKAGWGARIMGDSGVVYVHLNGKMGALASIADWCQEEGK